MRLTSLILLMAVLQVSATGTAQTLTYSAKELPMEQLFVIIEQQTGFTFFYDSRDLKGSAPVTMDFKATPVEEALKRILVGRPLSFSVVKRTVVIEKIKIRSDDDPQINFSFLPITGRITDGTGNPLAGATVRVKGKSVATVTDEKGAFLLAASAGDVLMISYIGFQNKSITITGTDLISITLEKAELSMDTTEILINTGYQKVKPNEINGDVSVINNKMLNARTGTNILDRLVGQTSGLTVNIGKTNLQHKTGISIRGLGTINGPQDPLIVLDGFIYEGDINNINPFDIENVSILKDASASSIWGARAGNGVIVLTSKRARLNQPLTVTFNANATLRSLPDLNSVPQMTAAESIEAERFLFDKGYFNSRISGNYWSLSQAIELLLARRNNQITDAQLEDKLNAFRSINVQKEWRDAFYANALMQQYGLNMRTGAANHSFGLSGTLDRSYDQNYARLQRGTIGLSDQLNIGSRLSVISSFTLTLSNSSSGRPAFGSIQNGGRQSYQALRDDAGNPINWPQEFRAAYTDTAGMGKLLDWGYYPAEDYKHNITKNTRQEISGHVMLRYRILPYLNVEASYQGQKQWGTAEFLMDELSYEVRRRINTFSQVNRSTGVVTYNVPRGGSLQTDRKDVTSSTARLQFNLDKKIHLSSLNVLAGAEARELETRGEGSFYLGYQEDPLNFIQVNNSLTPIAHFITGNQEYIPGSARLTRLQNRFVSLYANASYSYKGKYRISASGRRDGSNVFGASTNDKWKPLWSTGIGWSVSKEKFYEVKWLPELRLSITYGKSGNVDLSKTAKATGASGSNSLSPLPFARIRQVNNPDLRWEQLSQFNLKVDFSTLNNVLAGSVSIYRKYGSDLYGSFLYDYTTWGSSAELTRNVANMEGRGVDINITGKILDGNTFKWSTSLFLGFNKSKTVKYYRTVNNLSVLLGAGTEITPMVGMPLYAVAGYKWGGLNGAGDPQGYVNGQLSTNYTSIATEGRTTATNIRFFGAANPVYSGSLINSVELNNFSLSFNLNFRLKYFTTKSSIRYYGLANNGVGHPDYSLRWQKPGDEKITHVPAFAYPININRDTYYAQSEINVIAADNIRLDYINLGYHVNAEKWKVPFRSLEIFCNGANLGILWKASKAVKDPDYQDQVGQTKAYTLGIRGNF